MKAFKIILTLLILSFVGLLVTSFVMDELASGSVESQLNAIELPAGASKEASISKTGKLTSKTGALQYYGAILVKSNQSLGEMRSHYLSRQPNGLTLQIIPLSDAAKTFGTDFDSKLRFNQHDSAPQGYYIIYAFAEPPMPFPMFDYRTYF